MEGGLFLIFIVVAMVARAIEAMKGEKRPPQPPRQRRPRPEYQRPHGTTRGDEVRLPQPRPHDRVPSDATAEAAAEMIPDELWEILTGSPKPRRAPQRVPEPSWDEEADQSEAQGVTLESQLDEEDEFMRRKRAEEERRARERSELAERRQRGREANTADKAPVVVSLEQTVIPAAARHAAFHRKIEAPVVAKPPRRSARQRLFTGDDLKRAIVLHEVLGTPKGLE